MKIACLGGGPAGLYFAISMKLRDARARHHRVRAQQAGRHVRLGRGAVRRDLRQHRRERSAERRRDPPPFRLLGRHRGALSRAKDRLDRPWLFRHRAQEAAATPATARPRARRRSTVPDRGRQRRGAGQDPRPRRRRRRTEFQDAQRIRRPFQARRRDPQEQIRLAWHPPEIRRRLHLHFRRDRARLDLGARLPVRRRHRDLHRRMRRRHLAEVRLRHDEPGGESAAPASESLQSISAATG